MTTGAIIVLGLGIAVVVAFAYYAGRHPADDPHSNLKDDKHKHT